MVFLLMHSEFGMDLNAKRLAGSKIFICAHLQSAHLQSAHLCPWLFTFQTHLNIWERNRSTAMGRKSRNRHCKCAFVSNVVTAHSKLLLRISLFFCRPTADVHCADVSQFFFLSLFKCGALNAKKGNGQKYIFFFMNKCYLSEEKINSCRINRAIGLEQPVDGSLTSLRPFTVVALCTSNHILNNQIVHHMWTFVVVLSGLE